MPLELARGVTEIFSRSLRRLQGVLASSSETAWREDLRFAMDTLKELNQSTEVAFASVGGNLMDLLSRARDLHSAIERLLVELSGEQAQRASQALIDVRDYIGVIQDRSRAESERLASIQSGASQIRSGFAFFEQIGLSFHITAVLARIETAHLTSLRSGQELSGFADEVLVSSQSIRERATHVLGVANEFDARVCKVLRQISQFEEFQLGQVRTLLTKVDQDLGLLAERQQAAAAISHRLEALLKAVTADLAAVANALQFHDITRQKVEHVVEALESVMAACGSGGLSSDEVTLIRVQKAQMEEASSSFARSCEKIEADLAAIAGHIGEMSAATAELSEGENSQSFLDAMAKQFSTISSTLVAYRGRESEIRSFFQELDQFGGQLHESLGELRTLEFQLSRIALNAAISASHLGTPGDPLTVVSSAMQDLHQKCASRSTAAEEALGQIQSTAQSMAVHEGAASQQAGEELLRDLDLRLNELRGAKDASSRAISGLSGMAAELVQRLDEARGQIAVGAAFESASSICGARFDRIVSEAKTVASSRQPGESAHHQRYTMETERTIHQAITGMGPVDPPAPSEPSSNEEEVEFF